MTRVDYCKSCRAPIFWVRTSTSKMMPVDRDPVADGNIQIVDGVANVVPKKSLVQGQFYYKSHFATCPHHAAYRKAK